MSEAENPNQATPKPQRRRRASVGGHALKLEAEQRPGHTRRWVNADPLRIQQMEELGYSMVADPAGEGKRRTDGLGTRITRHAGRTDQGAPYQTILMETPNELYAEGLAEKEQGRQAFEDTIRRGLKTEDTPDGAYIPSRSTITHSG